MSWPIRRTTGTGQLHLATKRYCAPVRTEVNPYFLSLLFHDAVGKRLESANGIHISYIV